MPCAVFRFLQFVGMGYFPKLFVVVLVVVKYEIINIRESIPTRHNLNINVGDIYTGKLMGQKNIRMHMYIKMKHFLLPQKC